MRHHGRSFRTRRTIEHSLHEIDRRALNAMVLVKRHGNKLASYGVVAQAFREQAVHLKEPHRPCSTPLRRWCGCRCASCSTRFADMFHRRTNEV